MEKEIWKYVVGYENLYEVSNLGRVKSLFRYKKILKPIVGVQGYLNVTLYDKNKKQKSKRIHQLVAQAFIKNNTWNINDKEQIKELLLIIWNSITNQKFEIEIDLGE